jgi:hypothetical protein
MNTSVAPLNDIKVREAIALAVNQKEILASIFGGLGMVANNFLVSALQEANINPKFNISYNADRSRKLFDEAGWVMGANGIRAKGGTPLTLKLWTQNGTQFKRVTGQALAAAAPLPATPNVGGRYISRPEMEAMKEMRPGDDVLRKIRAFWFPPYDGAWVDVGGVRCTLVSPEILLTLAAPGVSNLFTRPAGEPAADGND